MKKLILALAIVLFASVSSFATFWTVRTRAADIRTAPSSQSAVILTLPRDPFFSLNEVSRRKGWIKVQFVNFVPRRAFRQMLAEGAAVQELGYEGGTVQAKITGWTRSGNLRRKGS